MCWLSKRTTASWLVPLFFALWLVFFPACGGGGGDSDDYGGIDVTQPDVNGTWEGAGLHFYTNEPVVLVTLDLTLGNRVNAFYWRITGKFKDQCGREARVTGIIAGSYKGEPVRIQQTTVEFYDPRSQGVYCTFTDWSAVIYGYNLRGATFGLECQQIRPDYDGIDRFELNKKT